MARLEGVFRGWDKYEVPVTDACFRLYACYQVIIRDKTAKDLKSTQQYELARQLYNTEQVLFNVCNIATVATFALVCLRYLPLCLTTVVTAASFWVARELILQDASGLENGLVEVVIDSHKKVDPDWKASIEWVGMIWARRILPQVPDENINKVQLGVKLAKLGISDIIQEGSEKIEEKVDELVGQGKEALKNQGLYPNLDGGGEKD